MAAYQYRFGGGVVMTDLLIHYRKLTDIAKGWALKHLAGWSDDIHRELLVKHGATAIDGRISASSLTLDQLNAVLEDYVQRGWPRRLTYKGPQQATPKITSAQIGMMVKLWRKLGQAGKVSNVSRPALSAFCARQTAKNVHDLDSLSGEECQDIIEALKAWLRR